MAYITRNANILLVFLIVLTAIFLVGIALFATSEINSLNSMYTEKVNSLKDVEADLQSKIKLLDQVKQELKLKQERETSFTQKYTQVKGEKKTVQQSLDRTAAEKKQALDSLASTQNQLTDLNSRLNFDEAQIAQQNAQISQMQSDLRSITQLAKDRLSQISTLTSQLNACQHPSGT